jgi:hypothetical protein
MRNACWKAKAADTSSEYLIFIALPRKQWLRERASLLRYEYNALYFFKIISKPIPLYYKSHFIWQHKCRGSISSDISTGKEVKTRSQKFNLKCVRIYTVYGAMNIVAYGVVLISVFVDVSHLIPFAGFARAKNANTS